MFQKGIKLLGMGLALAICLAGCGGGGEGQAAASPSDTPGQAAAQQPAEIQDLAVGSDALQSESSDAPDTVLVTALLPGYVYYENAPEGLRFQYPESWLLAGSQEFTAEQMRELEEKGIDPQLFTMSMDMTSAYLYDLESADDAFTPNLNYNVQSCPGLTASALVTDASIAELSTSFAEQFDAIFDGFSWVTAPEKRSYGEKDFVYFVSGYELDGSPLCANQAITIHENKMFTFTYTTARERDASVFEAVLDTLEWIQ